MYKSGKVMLVTAAQGGCGRTMAAVGLATCLTRHGTVALVAENFYGYFGDDIQDDTCFGPPEECWTGDQSPRYPKNNLRLLRTNTGDLDWLSKVISKLRLSNDFVIVTRRCPIQTGAERLFSDGLARLVDAAVVLYRHNRQSHTDNKILLDVLAGGRNLRLVLPMVNFTATSSEVERGSKWSMAAMFVFRKPLAEAGHISSNPSIKSVEQVFYNTAIPFCAYTSYGAVNVSLKYSPGDAMRPAFAIHNAANLLLDAIEEPTEKVSP